MMASWVRMVLRRSEGWLLTAVTQCVCRGNSAFHSLAHTTSQERSVRLNDRWHAVNDLCVYNDTITFSWSVLLICSDDFVFLVHLSSQHLCRPESLKTVVCGFTCNSYCNTPGSVSTTHQSLLFCVVILKLILKFCTWPFQDTNSPATWCILVILTLSVLPRCYSFPPKNTLGHHAFLFLPYFHFLEIHLTATVLPLLRTCCRCLSTCSLPNPPSDWSLYNLGFEMR